MTDEPKQTYLNQRGDAPSLYVDGYDGAVLGSGVVRLGLFEDVWNFDTNAWDRQFVQNIVISWSNFADVVEKLGVLAAGFKVVIDQSASQAEKSVNG